jgi:leader peptidase (prepilin peptidase)/N-methyltransferase
MELFMGILVFVLGLCCGSFVNMLVYRTAGKYELRQNPRNPLEKGVKTKSNRSVCDFCGKQLNWFDNIPVVSWLWLRGKSGCCHKNLPVSYPLTEAVTGILFLIFFILSIFNWQMVLGLVVITLLVFLAVFDMKYMILPGFASDILIGAALVNLVCKADWWQYLTVGVMAYLFFWGLSKLKIKGKQAMGGGDAPLALFMGLWLGWPLALVAFYTAFISGAAVGGGMMAAGRKKGGSQIAFGPFLILGTVVAWWGGEVILKLLNL